MALVGSVGGDYLHCPPAAVGCGGGDAEMRRDNLFIGPSHHGSDVRMRRRQLFLCRYCLLGLFEAHLCSMSDSHSAVKEQFQLKVEEISLSFFFLSTVALREDSHKLEYAVL